MILFKKKNWHTLFFSSPHPWNSNFWVNVKMRSWVIFFFNCIFWQIYIFCYEHVLILIVIQYLSQSKDISGFFKITFISILLFLHDRAAKSTVNIYSYPFTHERTHLDFINYIHKYSISPRKNSKSTINVYSYPNIL